MAGEWIVTMTQAMTRKEPKTPMAFYSRMLWVVFALIVAPLYSPGVSVGFKVAFATTGVLIALALAIWVSVFAWKKPKYLLYGAETHFEEWKAERKQAGSGKTLTSGRVSISLKVSSLVSSLSQTASFRIS